MTLDRLQPISGANCPGSMTPVNPKSDSRELKSDSRELKSDSRGPQAGSRQPQAGSPPATSPDPLGYSAPGAPPGAAGSGSATDLASSWATSTTSSESFAS